MQMTNYFYYIGQLKLLLTCDARNLTGHDLVSQPHKQKQLQICSTLF